MSKRIVCFGDSNTWGYAAEGQPQDDSYSLRYPSEVRWTGLLKKLLGSEYTVLEQGHNGRTTVWDDPMAPHRNGSKALDVILETNAPIDLLVIMLGTNDMKPRISGYAFDVAEGIGKLVEKVRQNPRGRKGKVPKILLVSPVLIGSLIADAEFAAEFGGIAAYEESKKLAPLILRQAKKYGCAFLDAAQYADVGDDAIHLDAEGHRQLAEALAAKVKELL